MSEKAYLGLSLLVAAVSASLVWFSTLQGPGTTPESLQYLFAAQDLLEGESVFSLPRHWPPGYPLLISLPLSVGWDPAWALRVLHTAVAFLNVLLFAACVRPFQGGTEIVSLMATLSFALAPGVLGVSVMAWSEPAFLSGLLAALVALRAYLAGGSLIALGIAAACLGSALLTRYSAIAFIGVVAGWLLVVLWRPSRAHALVSAGAVSTVAVLPLAIWLSVPAGTGAGSAPRALAMHFVDIPRLFDALEVIGEWYHASVIGSALATCSAVASLALLVLPLRSGGAPETERRFVGLCLACAIGYAGFLLVSISFFDFYTPLDLRILWPLLVVAAVGVGAGAAGFARGGGGHLIFAGTVLTVPLVSGLPAVSPSVSANMREVHGYFNPAIRRMPILSRVGELGGSKIYSNAPELIRLHTGRRATMLPASRDMVRDRPIDEYQANLNALAAEVGSDHSVVVYFNAFRWRTYLPDREAFDRMLTGRFVYEGADGWVLTGPEAARSE